MDKSKIKNKKILITGATGFIGSNITRYFLKESIEVGVIFPEGDDLWRINDILGKISIFTADLRNKEQLNKAITSFKPHIIFHAAIYGGHIFQKDVNRIMQTNFLGTVNLLQACSQIDYELFVNTGSSSEYGIKSLPMSEDNLLEPATDYAVSKSAATLYAQALNRRENKPIVTLRLFSPFGYYDDNTRLIPSVILSCLKGDNPKVSTPKYVRDFIFIEDVIDAYVKVAENKEKIKGEIFNIGSGKEYSIGGVVDKIIAVSKCKVNAKWGQTPNSRLEPEVWQSDISKAHRLLGWKPKYSLEQGIEKTIDWFKSNAYLYNQAVIENKTKS
ncbi:MAG: NAD-dependent epimerase/dehydratase family protein [Candidatus Omnitrophota bacterium]